ncbi:MAG: 2-oxoglutarate/2-oxoacid ferredoxin oxidoreductase subunit beta [Thermotogota bacterium]|nr:2-oxoglutarate/2-oxoacid ferredoxin oxidoreductase subunit beta [Thermotogota bacterium]MDK2864506.1 2-oxoglutarate/2-oxoacid ferredoxin oxidoreductase subunit beta [Thermotogota bacterium]HCZ07468.1 2-oxoacid:ferredoxin oxidoreductase subunit beta [Thermotogota bacterium]
MKREKLLDYLRIDRIPTVWCPGCGNGIIMKAFVEAVDRLGLEKSQVAVVSGIGCSSRVTGYLDFNTLHTLHGRALAFATGVKLARPDLNVVVMGGDGDMLAIGGNHFIHACRRNLDITVIVFNNAIYGMTGGQVAPTTPMGSKASSAPYGNLEKPFDVVDLAMSAGATYVARSTVFHYELTVQYIKSAIEHRGFSVVDVITNCHTYFGRYNDMPYAPQMLEYFKKNSLLLKKAQTMSAKDLEGKIIVGEFRKEEKPEYLETYRVLQESLKDKG